MIKAVLLDFDGTLIDSVDSVWKEYQRTAAVLKLPERGFEDFARQLGKPWEAALLSLWPGVDTKKFTDVYRLEKEQVRAIDGVPEALAAIKRRCKLGVLTSRGSKTLFLHLESTGIGTKIFDLILHKESLRNHKPNPEALYQACEELGVTPSEAVYVGDSVVDAECAQKAGMQFIGVLTGGATRADFEKKGVSSDGVLESISMLPEKLKAI
jgi:pyrophosphatase PpaX